MHLIRVWIILFGSIIIFNWFSSTKPTAFPKDAQLIKEINSFYPKANAKFIQDKITIKKGHILVPFISSTDEYGLSLWVWNKHDWEVEFTNTHGEPKLWKIDINDPSTYYVIWNIHPNDQLDHISLYLNRLRGFVSSREGQFYYPRIQINKEISLRESSYGYMKMPNDWASIIELSKIINQENQTDNFFNFQQQDQSLSFGWIPYDKNNKEKFPEETVNGDLYFNRTDSELEHIMIINESDLE
jgi:hypothetical protein